MIDAGIDLPAQRVVEVVGDTASLTCPDPWSGRPSYVEIHGDRLVRRIDSPGCDPYELQLAHFCATVRGVVEPLSGRKDAVAQAATLSALQSAARSGAATEVRRTVARTIEA